MTKKETRLSGRILEEVAMSHGLKAMSVIAQKAAELPKNFRVQKKISTIVPKLAAHGITTAQICMAASVRSLVLVPSTVKG